MTLNRTALFPFHQKAGARLVDFGGWEMPVQFEGILAEHKAVREAAGLFDISHMGQVWVTGSGAQAYLQNLVTNDVSKLAPGQGCYALMCRDDGGVVDDLYVYLMEPGRYFLVINASRRPIDVQWMKDHKKGDVTIEELTQNAAVALQGPRARDILKRVFPQAAGLAKNRITVQDCLVSCTGYTGEDGFEIFGPADKITALYPRLLEAGKSGGLKPCGLGARDTLRLEMGYRLYGNDLDERHTGLEAGLGWVIKFDKGPFIGRDALLQEKTKGPQRRFIAFRLKDRGIPRHGHQIFFKGRLAGEVTSGTFSPSLQIGIGMGYVDARLLPKEPQNEPGLAVKVHEREIPAEVVPLPFYRNPAVISQ